MNEDRRPGAGGRIDRFETMIDRVSERIGKVDAALARHGGADELRERLSRRADELVSQAQDVVAHLGAIEADVVEGGHSPAATDDRAVVAAEAAARPPVPRRPHSPMRRALWLAFGVALVVIALRRRR